VHVRFRAGVPPPLKGRLTYSRTVQASCFGLLQMGACTGSRTSGLFRGGGGGLLKLCGGAGGGPPREGQAVSSPPPPPDGSVCSRPKQTLPGDRMSLPYAGYLHKWIKNEYAHMRT
jgi:hypothetical protein